MAPIDITAKSQIAHSERFSEQIRTRSPATTPLSIRRLAQRLTLSAISSQFLPTHEPSILSNKNGFVLCCATLAKKAFGKFASSQVIISRPIFSSP